MAKLETYCERACSDFVGQKLQVITVGFRMSSGKTRLRNISDVRHVGKYQTSVAYVL